LILDDFYRPGDLKQNQQRKDQMKSINQIIEGLKDKEDQFNIFLQKKSELRDKILGDKLPSKINLTDLIKFLGFDLETKEVDEDVNKIFYIMNLNSELEKKNQ